MVKGGGGRVYTHTNTDTGRYMYVYTYIRGRWQKVRKRVGCFEINENTSTLITKRDEIPVNNNIV